MPLELSVVIRAQNEASQALRQLEGDFTRTSAALTRASGEVARATELTGREIRNVTATIRTLAGQVVSEVNPALGSMVFTMASAAREARGLSAAKASMVVAIATAGAALAGFIASARDAARAQVELNRAVNSLDFSGALGQLRQFVIAQQTFEAMWGSLFQRLSEQIPAALTTSVGRLIRALPEAVREPLEVVGQRLATLFGSVFGRVDPALLEQARTAVRELFPVERAREAAETARQLNEVLQQQRQIRIERALEEGDEARALDQLRELEQLQHQLLAIERERLTLQARLRAAPFEQLGLPDLAAQTFADLAQRLRELDEQAQVRFERLQAQRRAIEERERERRFRELEAEAEAARQRAEEENLTKIAQDEATRQLERQRRLEALEADRERLSLLAQIPTLREAERAQLELVAVTVERSLKIEQARGDAAKEQLAELEARIRAEAVLRREIERTTAVGGLEKGLRETQEEFEQVGVRMETIARSTAQNMQRAFSDQFFAVLTGDFRRLPDIGRDFARAMLRAVTDELAKLAIAPILAQLRRAFSTVGTGAMVVLPAGAAGAVTGAIGGVPAAEAVVAGGLTPATFLGGISGVSGPVAPVGGGLGGGFGGIGMPPVGMLGTSGVTALDVVIAAQMGGVAALSGLGTGAAVVSGGQLIHSGAELALMGTAAPGVAGAPATTGTALAGAGAALGAAGAALGLGLTVWGALQGPPTTENIAMSGVSGAISGAILGTMIMPGIGTLIGAIAGAALGAGAGAMGKGGPEFRERVEIPQAREMSELAEAFVRRIEEAQTLDEIFTILTTPNHLGRFGGFSFAIGGGIREELGTGNLVPTGRLIRSMDDLIRALEDPSQLVVGLHVGTSSFPAARRELRERVEASLRQIFARRRDQLLLALAQIPVAMEEVVMGPTGPVLRRTLMSGLEARTRLAAPDLLAPSPDIVRARVDPDMAEVLLRLLEEVDRDRRLGILSREVLVGL
jgi:hypothetical protein